MGWPWESSDEAKKSMRDLSQAVRDRMDKQQHTFDRLLGGDESTLDKLNFSIEENGQEVTFNRWQYFSVAAEIADGKIKEKPVSQAGVLPVVAAYGMGNDTMYLASTSPHSAKDRATLVHEMTHAIIDKENADQWTAATNEGAAYIAQVAFLSIKGEPTISDEEKKDPLGNDMLTKALGIVQKSGMNSGRKASKVNTYPEWSPYREAVKKVHVATGAWMDMNTLKSQDGDQKAGANGLLDPRVPRQ